MEREINFGESLQDPFLAMFQTKDLSSQLTNRNILFFSGNMKCGLLASFRLTQREMLIVRVITTKRAFK